MIQKQTKARGFTIVELLIVIVVIAILAAITIVAYNGVQQRAKSSAGQSLANAVIKKAEIFNATENGYPTNAALVANTGAGTAGNPKEAKLDNVASVQTAVVTSATASNGSVVTYLGGCTGGGAKVGYWDYAAATPAVVYMYMGGATSASLNCA